MGSGAGQSGFLPAESGWRANSPPPNPRRDRLLGKLGKARAPVRSQPKTGSRLENDGTPSMATPNRRHKSQPRDLKTQPREDKKRGRSPRHRLESQTVPGLMAPVDPNPTSVCVCMTPSPASYPIDQLSTAAACGDLSQVRRLISVGISVNQQNKYGRTPLQVMRLSRPDIAEALLIAGADSNVRDRSRKAGGRDTLVTPLHDAAHQGFILTVRCLLRHGADLEARDAWGNTAAHVAAKQGHAQVVRYLAQGLDVAHCENHYSLTPLDFMRRRHDNDPVITKWIEQMNKTPPSLKRLTCMAIRRTVGPTRLVQYRSLTFLHPGLQDYVMLQDENAIGLNDDMWKINNF